MPESKATARLKPFDVTEVSGPHRDTATMPSALRLEKLLEACIEETKETRDETRETRRAVDNIAGQQVTIITRLSKLEADAEEERRKRSGAIRAVTGEAERGSKHNLEQDAVIAHVVTRLAAVESNQAAAATERGETAALVREIKSDVSSFLQKHPALSLALVTLATTLATALTGWLTRH